MTKDYATFMTNKGNLPVLVNEVYEQYKPLILKKASLYERCSKGRILIEDFASDVFIRLFNNLGILDENRMNPENFSFYISVARAITYNYAIEKKRLDAEFLLLNDEECENSFSASRTLSETTVDVTSFYSRLSQRQKLILKDKQDGIHEDLTRKNLGISHGTYVGDILKAKKVFAQFI